MHSAYSQPRALPAKKLSLSHGCGGMSQHHEFFMQQALQLADEAEARGEVPVGAVVVKAGEVIGRGFNQPISSCDPSAHAEIVALRDAAKHFNNYRLVDCDLYVTIEPCAMCAGAMVHARIANLYYGAPEPKAGAIESTQQFFSADWLNHQVLYEAGILESLCREKIQQFFQRKRSDS